MRADRRRRRQRGRLFPPHGVVMPWEEEWTRIGMMVALGAARHERDYYTYVPWDKTPAAFREGIRDGWLSGWPRDGSKYPARCYSSLDYSSGFNEGRALRGEVEERRKGERTTG